MEKHLAEFMHEISTFRHLDIPDLKQKENAQRLGMNGEYKVNDFDICACLDGLE